MFNNDDRTPAWGARPAGDGAWRFGLWAPSANRIDLRLNGSDHAMARSSDGWHEATVPAAAGDSYAFVRDGTAFSDPAARAQENGPGGPSVLVDPATLPRHTRWAGRDWHEAVVMEVHVGTFTRDGTFEAAAREIGRLSELGVTAINLMPVTPFPGDRGWGYDGVLPHAVHGAYGTPEDLARFIAVAHEHGMMVLIDAVYNHFGPEGNVLSSLCPAFFDHDRQTPWGAAIAIDRPEVRAFFAQSAVAWLRDYGADGLRLDAVHELGPRDDTTFLHELGDIIEGLDLPHQVHLITEDERNLVSYVAPHGPFQAQWNDDYHHCIHCLLTGERHSYYAPYAVDPFGDLVTALRDGQVDQGQTRPAEEPPRGEPSSHVSPLRFVNANQTHDQIGNRALGERLVTLADPATVMVCHGVLLLAPFVPMLFMGEECGSRAPFQFFTDFDGDLAEAVRRGRRSEFPEFADAPEDVPDPNDRSTMLRSRPYETLPEDSAEWTALTGHLLAVRRERIVPLLASGWSGTEVERLADRTLRAVWRFGDGTLEIAFTLEGAPPSLSDGRSEIFHRAAETGAGLRVGIGASR